MKLPKAVPLVLVFVIFVLLCIEIFSYRTIFQTKFDKEYLFDLYNHSQWSVALSERGISDNLLYQVAGYDLVTSQTFFTINPETPPLGKYLYGVSILLFQNAEILALGLFLISVLLMYQLTTLLFKNPFYRLIGVLVYVFEPMLFSQMSQSMMDIPQLIGLMVHVLAFFYLLNAKTLQSRIMWVVLLGASLGFFVSVKIGFFAVCILFADTIFLHKSKNKKVLIPVLFVCSMTYVGSYLVYFLQGNSLVDFLRAQKWILSFYASSDATSVFYSPLTALLFGMIKSWGKYSVLEHVDEFTFLWPLYFLSMVILLRKWKKWNIPIQIRYLIVLVASLFVLFMLVPFFARYLILILPFLILLGVYVYSKIHFPKYLIIFIFALVGIQWVFYLFSGPKQTLRAFEQNWKNGAYQDMYSSLLFENEQMERTNFWRTMQTFEKNFFVIDRVVEIEKPLMTFPWSKNTVAYGTITYTTELGPIVNSYILKLEKVDNQWKVVWNDAYAYETWNRNREIVSQLNPYIPGNLYVGSVAVTEILDWPFIYITPQYVTNERDLQKKIYQYTQLATEFIENKYKANNQFDWPVEIAPLSSRSGQAISSFESEPAVTIVYKQHRVIDEEVVKKTEKAQIEKLLIYYSGKLNPVAGGSVCITIENACEVVIETVGRDGEDVFVENFQLPDSTK